jgi:selenocysteine lyase/cysteine desulfurase
MKRNLTPKEAAQYLQERGVRVSHGTLNIWRSQRRGPRYKRVGRHVYYEREDLDRFEQGVKIETTESRCLKT